MSTTAVSAGQIMDRVANLLNDPRRTDYTYPVMIPYLNMAIEELSELMEESQNSPSQMEASYVLPAGTQVLASAESGIGTIFYPGDLTEIQEISERPGGSTSGFVKLPRVETLKVFPQSNSLLYWMWEDQQIKFNPLGANTPIQVLITYLRQGIPYIVNENSQITMINSRSYLAYKTAAFCAMFIGENETRAAVLQSEAEKAVERLTNISTKGRQQIMTRHRPFRAGWKARGSY